MTKNREKNQKINFSGQNCLKIFEFLTPTKLTKNREKNREQLFLAQNCLNRIMSQLLDNTNKTKKIEEKNRKIIFGSEFSETNNEPTFRLHQKIDKNREKLFSAQRIMSQLLDYTKKMTKNREKIRKILLGQNCLRL